MAEPTVSRDEAVSLLVDVSDIARLAQCDAGGCGVVYPSEMKRFAAIAVAGLALTACGSSGHVTYGSPPLKLVPPSPISLRFSISSNRAFARRDVQQLIRNVVLPRSARRVPAVPQSAPAWFREELSHNGPGTAFAHRTWIVDEPLVTVVRYFRTHARPRPRPVRGFNDSPNRIGSRPNDNWQFAPVPGRSSNRWLNVAMLALPSGATVVTAQAGDEWIQPPPRSAELPGTVRRVDITSRYGANRPSVRVHVRDRNGVGSVVAWMNGLGVSPRVFCAGQVFGEPVITLTFRDGHGAVVARATIGNSPSEHCGALSLTVNGRKAPPLITGDLLLRVQQHLNLDLSPPKPGDVASCLRQRHWTVSTVDRRLTAQKKGRSVRLTFLLTGKVSGSRRPEPEVARCLRESPRFVYLG